MVTMTVPGETEAGSAGMQPCRGITWRAHRDDDWSAEVPLPRSSKTQIGSVDPDALKIPARRAECSLTENARSPFHAEPGHNDLSRHGLRISVPRVHLVSFLYRTQQPAKYALSTPVNLLCRRSRTLKQVDAMTTIATIELPKLVPLTAHAALYLPAVPVPRTTVSASL
jgi:hypothetical protein